VSKNTRRTFFKKVGAGTLLAYGSAEAEEKNTVREKSRDIPVVHTCDICVVGGGCTGVFSAVRAARLGAKVALIENNGYFGGVGTAGLVNIWHSTYDTAGKQKIIGGLTGETIDRLVKRNSAVISNKVQPEYTTFNSAELVLELDKLAAETKKIRPFLHTRFVMPVSTGGRMTHAIIEDKTGRRAIQADYFIDSTGDGDVIARMGLPTTKNDDIQPPTACAILAGIDEIEKKNPGFDLAGAVYDQKFHNALQNGFLWYSDFVGLPGVRMVAGTRIHNADCSDADELTRAEIEGRRQIDAMCEILRSHYKGGESISLVEVPSYIGIRETRHAQCLHSLTEKEVLEGRRFQDAIANGSYRIDIHYSNQAGLTFRYLDGREIYVEPGKPDVKRRWRESLAEDPTFYQIPYRSLVPVGSKNVLVAGRLIGVDRGAYGAVRVMVNCNQTGEAAGTACALALETSSDVSKIDTEKLRETLKREGSIII
jgi:hypothetical protein